jgi:hypothetical protein
MPRRRWLLLLPTAAAVAALAGVVALDRRAAADWDTACANPTVTYNETNPPPPQLKLTGADIVLFEFGTFTPAVNNQGRQIR